jgi:hypothetical protein
MGPRTHGPWLGSTEVDGARAFYGPDHYFSVERTRFEAAQDAAGLGGGKGLVEGAGGMDRQIVLHDTDAGGLGVMDIDEFAHAVSIIHGGAPFGDFDLAPGPMRIEGDEEIDGAVAAVLVIVTLALSRLGWDRLAHLADKLDGGFVEADQRPLGIRRFSLEIEHVFHAGDVFAIDMGNAPHVPAPRLEVIIGQPAAHGLA